MTVLLTGGTGYIGSHTAVELLDAGYEVIIADNFSNSSPDIKLQIENITGKKVKFCIGADVSVKPDLQSIFSLDNIEAVIHFAGYKAVGESVKEPLKYYRNNIDSTLTLLEVMVENNVKNIIFSSSATVYGTPEKLPLVEDMGQGVCTNPYGSTKQMIERIITDTAACGGLSAVLLRYFNPAGAHKSGLIGELPSGIPNNLMPYITQVADGKLKELNVFGNDYPTKDGTGVRDYIHVVDLAKGHVKALEYCMELNGVEIFNLGTGEGYSVLEMVEAFERVNNVKVPYKIAPRRDGDVAECYANAEKASRLMNWKADLKLDDMCRDAWIWQVNLR